MKKKIKIVKTPLSEDIQIFVGLDSSIRVSKSEMSYIIMKLIEEGHLDYKVIEGIKEELHTE